MAPVSVLAFAPNSWKGQWVNRQYLLSRLGSTRRVIYSTGAWFTWQRNTTEWTSARWAGGLDVESGVLVETPPRWILRNQRFVAWDRWALGRHSLWLQRSIDPNGTGYICLIFHPQFEPYLRHLAPCRVAYHAYDLFDATPGWTAELESQERRLLKQAHLVTTVSQQIAERLLAKGAREVHIIPNGVDESLFDANRFAPVPSDMQTIPRPRLGYVGSLHPQVDYALMAEIAQRRPDWQVVLIGDAPAYSDTQAASGLARCRGLVNVHFLGSRERHRVPAYMMSMDVNLMPYRVDNESWVVAGHPLKLYEYLASGKPVVAARLPTLSDEGRLLRFAEGVEDWIKAISEALAEIDTDAVNERIEVARHNGWSQRAATLERLLSQ